MSWETLGVGALGGVVAGVVLTFLVRMWDCCRTRGQRKKQVARIRDEIACQRAEIYDAPHDQRAGVFTDLSRKLKVIVLDLDTLKPSELRDIKGFVGLDGAYERGPDWFVQVFNNVESHEWLGLKPASRDHAIFSEIQGQS